MSFPFPLYKQSLGKSLRPKNRLVRPAQCSLHAWSISSPYMPYRFPTCRHSIPKQQYPLLIKFSNPFACAFACSSPFFPLAHSSPKLHANNHYILVCLKADKERSDSVTNDENASSRELVHPNTINDTHNDVNLSLSTWRSMGMYKS